MSDSKQLQKALGIQLELFQSTKRLNLSETYEVIPKDVSSNDPLIKWVSKFIAEPVEKCFSIEGKSYVSEISPANFKNKRTKQFQSHFPDLREARIEYAIISLASKQIIDIDTDSEDKRIFTIRTTYYQIQKEIVEAINKRESKDLKPNECPYNTTSIREALEVLKRTDITVKNHAGDSEYIFNRIKDIYMDNKKVVIELGNMITSYISSGDWRATDSNSILASKGKYELSLRIMLNMRFRYASENGKPYSPSLTKIIQDIDFVENKYKRITLQKIVAILEKMHEVKRVEVDKKFEGRKLVDAILHIYATSEFSSMMIENNKMTKRTKEAILDQEGSPLIEPMQVDYSSSAEFHKAKREYEIKKGKMLLG
ncbi:hypothetical protein BPLS_P6583 [Bathymodiolus platifrons methanotrophic gill symbiont]|uniref:hypothetical protein n=2 Tax=unclassified Gammaproteobacteria TaxID=33811 RepID=UPI001B3FDE04|nr:hypothetical protein [Bathymodiolus platifrons methanotrophic gill symbiont]GFO77871.1 hypothetical protein BPLS_P6583 [Bathymodiolus platifrons methanotrophic gill symbiont]